MGADAGLGNRATATNKAGKSTRAKGDPLPMLWAPRGSSPKRSASAAEGHWSSM